MLKADKILKSTDKFKINLGLQRVQQALKFFNHPEVGIDFIHIAGTNGKGSTAAIIEQILLEYGQKTTGKYTSPHLFSYTERFSINGVNIKEDELDELTNIVLEADRKHNIGLSEFEILTVICFLYFKRHNVEIGILEVGLGGRLDATNVINNPLVSIITSISYDHKERLGDTIEKIAYEKAGILKKGSKCAFLSSNNGYKTLLKEAQSKGAILIPEIDVKTENGFAYINDEKIPFSLSGDFQEENLKLALMGINALPFKISNEIIKTALSKVKWRFRMENVNLNGANLLLDGCHNPDGARVLRAHLNKYYKNKKIKFIFGCLSNKDYREILNTLYSPLFDFCFYEFNYPNSLKYENLDEFKDKLRKINDPFVEINKKDFDLCVVSGSLYMLGETFKGKF